MPRSLCVLPGLLVALAAQQPNRVAPSSPASLPASLPASIVFVDDGADAIQVRGERYKLGLGAAGVTFQPLFGPRAPRDFPVAFTFGGLKVAGIEQPFATGCWRRQDGVFVREHTIAQESWRCEYGHAQQYFVVPRPVAAGELTLRIGVATDLVGQAEGPGVRFVAAGLGAVHYSDAVVFDALGERLDVPVGWDGATLSITVPAAFASRAAWPLLIDPLVTTFALDTTVSDVRKPRVACEPVSGNWLAVAEEVLSGTDTDVVCSRFANDGTLLEVVYAESGTDRANNPDVGFLATSQQFVVAWHVASGTGGFTMRSRSATGTTQTSPVSVSTNIGIDLGCRVLVGSAMLGSRVLLALLRRVPGQASISVTQRSTAGANLATQFVVNLSTAGGGNFDLAGITTVATNSDRWQLAWQECTTAACTARTLRMRVVGTLTGLSTGVVTDLVTGANVDQAAFCGAGGRAFAVWRDQGPGSPDIFGVPIGGSGTLYNLVGAVQNLTAQEPGAPLGLSRSAPTVSYDGVRFLYGYLENNGAGTLRPYAATVFVDAALAVQWHEGHLQLANAMTRTLHLNHGADGNRGVHFAAFQQDGAGGLGDAGAALVDARTPGGTQAVDQTGCGAPSEPVLALAGTPALGRTLTFTITAPGFPFFLVGSPPTSPTPLPGCVGCLAGVDLSGMQAIAGSTLLVAVPAAPGLIGAELAFQGLAMLQPGGCPAAFLGFDFALTDTIRIRVL